MQVPDLARHGGCGYALFDRVRGFKDRQNTS